MKSLLAYCKAIGLALLLLAGVASAADQSLGLGPIQPASSGKWGLGQGGTGVDLSKSGDASISAAFRRLKRVDRVRSAAGVMASPPTIAYGTASAASTLNSNAQYVHTYFCLTNDGTASPSLNTTGPFRWSGGAAINYGTTHPNWHYVSADTSKLTSPTGEPTYVVEFDLYGGAFEIDVKGLTGVNFQMFIDDAPIALAATIPGVGNIPNTGSNYRIKFTLAATQLYRIRMECGTTCHIGGVDLAAGADLSYPSWPGRLPRCVAMGDSFTEGSGSATQSGPSSWIFEVGREMGWDMVQSGVGATGYLNNGGGGGKVKFRDRVVNDVINLAPDIVIVEGGYNDRASLPADIATEATLLYQQIRTALPNVPIYVVGIQSPGTPDATAIAIDTALSNVCAGFSPSIPYVSVLHAFDRLTGATWIGGDNIHPTDLGYHWWGRYITSRLLPYVDP